MCFCGYKGVFTMDEYKKKIIELVENIENIKVLEIIYNCIVNVMK